MTEISAEKRILDNLLEHARAFLSDPVFSNYLTILERWVVVDQRCWPTSQQNK